MIERYKFGSIVINGRTYNHDVIVDWDWRVDSWWRKESHTMDWDDFQKAIDKNPDVIIVGTGAYGVARITQFVQQEIAKKGIQLIVDKTEEAVKTFNVIQQKMEEGEEKKRIVGLFHLTC
jgi:hypothetical protein